jgi:predicted dehydrogenase
MRKPGGEWEDHPFPLMERDTPFINQANAFLDALEQKAAPLCTLEEGIESLRANVAILESARRGCWQKTD